MESLQLVCSALTRYLGSGSFKASAEEHWESAQHLDQTVVKQIFAPALRGIHSLKSKADELSFHRTSLSGVDYLT